MKQRKVVSIIDALVLIISAVLVITGCQNPAGSGNSRNPNTIVIKFDKAKIKCFDGSNNAEIPSDMMVAEGGVVWFTAINIPTGKIVDKWIIGKKIENATSSGIWYKISKNDAEGNTINVSYTLKIPAKLKIVFDNTKVICKKDDSEIEKNSEVLEQDGLEFTPKNITPNKVAVWKIKNSEQLYEFNYLWYNVKVSDANNLNEINLDYSERDKKEITIQFNASKVKCTNQATNISVTSGSKILEGVELKVETVDGSAVEWEIGSSAYFGLKKEMLYTVYEGDAEDDTIMVGF
ncbi:hypothetical protein ABH09_02595 [Treponema sp. OMZ 803]|uniref:hypothetical protein n=1 Tax=Treponema sp. OMZ 803 TaxID=120682 RepID=UPI0020A3F622|nr:hypothetical protein [Treponema sp. OMZ 803]UTC53572.1 hypothetical protein ABH09_02595 [Treponema sp. OMZ 803]